VFPVIDVNERDASLASVSVVVGVTNDSTVAVVYVQEMELEPVLRTHFLHSTTVALMRMFSSSIILQIRVYTVINASKPR
jgi:hypothetical protein